MAKQKFFQLGTGASLFVDPKTKTKITKGKPAAIASVDYMTSPKMVVAKKNGHIEEISEEEYKSIMAGEKVSVVSENPIPKGEENEEDAAFMAQIKDYSKDELIQYLNDEYELSDEDQDKYAQMKKKDLINEILRLRKA